MTHLNVSVNKREDIVLDDTHKISGTAAKLGKDTAYHHCTVLVDVNECVLHDALDSKAEGVESRATQSVRVPVKNLAKVLPNLNVNMLQEAVGWEFLRTNIEGEDEGLKAISKQRGFQMIRPDNDWFPGLDKLKEDFLSQQWIFGKTPKFKVKIPIINFASYLANLWQYLAFKVGRFIFKSVKIARKFAFSKITSG